MTSDWQAEVTRLQANERNLEKKLLEALAALAQAQQDIEEIELWAKRMADASVIAGEVETTGRSLVDDYADLKAVVAEMKGAADRACGRELELRAALSALRAEHETLKAHHE